MSRLIVNLGAVAFAALLTAGSAVADDAAHATGPSAAPAVAAETPAVAEAVVPGTTRVLRIAPRVAAPAPAPAAALTVAWDADKRAFVAPSSESLAAMLADFNRRMAEKAAAGGPLAPVGQVEQVTLASGAVRARATADMLSASLVRLDLDGRPVEMCVDGPEAAAEAFSAPLTTGPALQ